jgi:signal transduction histidine kinase
MRLSTDQMIAFFAITELDLQMLKEFQSSFEFHVNDIVDAFYRHLFSYRETKAFLEDERRVELLKHTQRQYLLDLCSGEINEKYLLRRMRIGTTHERIGLPLNIYIGAYSLIFSEIVKVIHQIYTNDAAKTHLLTVAFSKILHFDQSLATDTYVDASHKSIESKNNELEQLNKQINRFVGMVVHDLRSPLNCLIGFNDLLLFDRDKLDSESVEMVELMKNSAKGMLEIVNDLLDVSVLESTNITANTSDCDIKHVIDQSVRQSRALAAKKNIQIDVIIGKDIRPIEADNSKLVQVFINLISNSVKYSNCGTRIEIYVSMEEAFVAIDVVDQGLGIPQEDIKGLFKPFHKTSVRPTAGEKSTGLGLFIVRKIIEAHQGTISVFSVVGEGSKFSVKLPVPLKK